MAKTAADDLASRLRKSLRDVNTPLWLPELTGELADVAWRKLGDDLGLTPASYGTARVLRRDRRESHLVVASFDIPSADGALLGTIPIELLPQGLACRCAGPDVRFLSTEEILRTGISTCVEEALRILDTVPTVLPTVCSLVKTLHLIDSGNNEVDISFSDPGLPFSVFVSIPRPGAVASALRAAEALLHETMHLQLTLVEALVPLVKPTEGTYFSPWRNEYRTAQGVLHALYVFRVIEAFLGAAPPFKGPALAPLRRHARERRATITRQMREIRGFRECADLTEDGAAFVDILLGCTRSTFRVRSPRGSRLPSS